MFAKAWVFRVQLIWTITGTWAHGHMGGGGGQNQSGYITLAVTGSPHAPHAPRSPKDTQGITHDICLTSSKICGIPAKKNISLTFSAETFF